MLRRMGQSNQFSDEHFKVVYAHIHTAIGEAMLDPRLQRMKPEAFFDVVLSTVIGTMVSAGIPPEQMLMSHALKNPTERGAEILGGRILAGMAPPPAAG